MKSGPTLNGCTARPRRRSAPIRPSVIVVLPTPLWVPPITMALSGFESQSGASIPKRASSYHARDEDRFAASERDGHDRRPGTAGLAGRHLRGLQLAA